MIGSHKSKYVLYDEPNERGISTKFWNERETTTTSAYAQATWYARGSDQTDVPTCANVVISDDSWIDTVNAGLLHSVSSAYIKLRCLHKIIIDQTKVAPYYADDTEQCKPAYSLT